MKHFDWEQYIANYPDLVSSGINNQRSALIHYRLHGRSEGRTDKCINIYPVIVCIAKLESSYIESFVKYHLALGFKNIYLYDNEDNPTYDKLLNNERVIVNHLPGNNYDKPVQYCALDHFINNYMHNGIITHVAHIDIDEYIALKKHNSISDFIFEYIHGDCAAIAMSWRFFGDSGHIKKTNIPDPIRFTMCGINGSSLIKTLFNVKYFKNYPNDPHYVILENKYYIKTTHGKIINSSVISDIDLSVIQLNHYKAKTYEEFILLKTRSRACDPEGTPFYEDIDNAFNIANKNEIEDLTVYNFYKSLN
jgi:hypothetical protein